MSKQKDANVNNCELLKDSMQAIAGLVNQKSEFEIRRLLKTWEEEKMLEEEKILAIVKACESLAESGKIKEKVYGKQKVYVADQSQFPEVCDEEIKKMDKSIAELGNQLKTTVEEVKQLETVLRNFNSSIATADAEAELSKTLSKCTHYKQKLKLLKEEGKVVSPAEKEQVFKDRKHFVQAWRKRKRMTNDILNAVLEGYPHPKKQLYEDIGIETDEEYGVKIPDVS